MEPSRQMTAERVWQWYCRSDDNRRTSDAYENVRLAHRFYQGDQWRGVDAEGQNLPFYNFIQPIVDHKTAAVAMNTMTISYTPLDHAGPLEPRAAQICQRLTATPPGHGSG